MRIAVVFCVAVKAVEGREEETKADCESAETAVMVKHALEQLGHQVDLVAIDPDHLQELCKYDWVFNMAESICGFELPEYEIARRMEQLGIHFTGSNSAAMEACIDKAVTKRTLHAHGILTPAYETIAVGDEIRASLPFPLFVKPIHEDGSIGITPNSKVSSQAELQEKVGDIHQRYNQAALVEEYIEGRDITASILGNGDGAVVLPLSGIVYPPRHAGPRFLTYDAKWETESQEFRDSVATCPIELEDDLRAAITGLARRVYSIMGCRDYARVDFRLSDHTPYVLEVNPNPCISPVDSGFVRAATQAGYSYEELICKIMEHSRGREA